MMDAGVRAEPGASEIAAIIGGLRPAAEV